MTSGGAVQRQVWAREQSRSHRLSVRTAAFKQTRADSVISRRQTWMDHRRQEDRRDRSGDLPERNRRDRCARRLE